MTVDDTAVPGLVFAVITVALLAGALAVGEAAPGGRGARVLAGSSVAATIVCLALIALRFALVA